MELFLQLVSRLVISSLFLPQPFLKSAAEVAESVPAAVVL